jgi:precorrin-6A synthase
MRRMLIVGIGSGDPDHLTLQAIKALQRVDVLFFIDKGAAKDELIRLRRVICEPHMTSRAYRTVIITDPPRDRRPERYEQTVRAWHEQRVAEYQRAISTELADGECGAFLVWGDPSLYDSTLRIFEKITAKGVLPLALEVIPGITSIQALAARHAICLNKIGGPVHITTGRELARCLPTESDNVVVMLDGEVTLDGVDPDATMIHWGAYVGTEHEILRSGLVRDVLPELQRVRREAREAHGWIMDTYVLSKIPQR